MIVKEVMNSSEIAPLAPGVLGARSHPPWKQAMC